MEIKNIFKAGTLISAIIISFICVMLYSSSIGDVIVEQTIYEKKWNLEPLADGDPGAGVTGFFYAMYYPHQATPIGVYDSNLSNSSAMGGAYEFTDSVNSSMTNETPAATTFDIVIKWGWDNDTYNTTNSLWEDAWIYMLCTNAALSIGADTNMSWMEIYNSTNYYREGHYYLNNSGSGYTIGNGVTVNTTDVKPFEFS